MASKQEKEPDKSVLDDKDKFKKNESGEKLAHMGDKPKQRSEKSKAKES